MDLNKNDGQKRVSSFQSYRERFQQELSTREIQFLMRIFGRTSFKFFCFGLFVFGLNVILGRLLGDGLALLLYLVLVPLMFVSFLPTYFMRRRYERDPLSASPVFKTGLFSLTSFQFVSIFLIFIQVYRLFLHDSSSSGGLSDEVSSALFVAFVFITAWLIYLIPVFVAWFLISRKQAIKLSKFVFRCQVCCILTFLVLLSAAFFGYGGSSFFSITYLVVFFLVSIILLLSPIVTLYKFKATTYAINYDNEEETKGWSDYFGFVMLEQMLILAVQLMRIVLQVLSRR